MSFVTPPWNQYQEEWQFDTFTTGYFVVSALTTEGTMKLTFDKTSTGPDSGLSALEPTLTYLEYEIYFNKEGGHNVLIPGSSVPIPSSIIRSPGWNYVKITNRVVVNGQDIGAGNPQKIDCWLLTNTTSVPDYVYIDYVAIQRAGDVVGGGTINLGNVTGVLPVQHGGTAVTISTGRSAAVLNVEPVLKNVTLEGDLRSLSNALTIHGNVYTDFLHGNVVGAYGLPIGNTVGVLPRWRETDPHRTGTGNTLMANVDPVVSNSLTVLGDIYSSNIIGNVSLTYANGLLPVSAGGTGTTFKTGTGAVVLNTNAVFKGTTTMANVLANYSGNAVGLHTLNVSNATVGVLAVEHGGTGVTTKTGTGNVVLSDNPVLNNVTVSGALTGNVFGNIFGQSAVFNTLTTPNITSETIFANTSVTTAQLYGNLVGQTAVVDTLLTAPNITSETLFANTSVKTSQLYGNLLGQTAIVDQSITTPTLTVSNNADILGNLSVFGNLVVASGNVVYVDSEIRTSEQIIVDNAGDGAALIVKQSGAQPIMEAQDDGNVVFKIYDEGSVAFASGLDNRLNDTSSAPTGALVSVLGNVSISQSIDTPHVYGNISGQTAVMDFLVGDGWQVSNIVPANVVGLVQTLEAANANILTLSSNVDTLSANTDALSSYIRSNVDTLSSNIDTLSSNVDTLSSNVGTLSSNVDTLSSNVDTLSSNVDTLSANTDALSSYVRSNIDTLSSNVGTLSSNVDTLSANTDALSSYVRSNIDTLSSNVDTLSANVNTLSTNVDTLSTTVQGYTDTFTTGNLYATALADLPTTIADSLTVRGNTRLQGNLIIDSGNVVYVDSQVEISEQLVVHNQGTGPAVDVLQTGAESLARFVDDGNVVMQMYNWGNVAFAHGSSTLLNNTTQSPSDALVTVFGSFAADSLRGNLAISNVVGLETSLADLWANAGDQQSELISVWANAGEQQTELTNLWANAGEQQTLITALEGNAGDQQTEIAALQTDTADLWANAGDQQTELTNLWANAGDQQTELTNLWANAGDQQTELTNLWANAGLQQTEITALQTDTADLWSNAQSQQILLASLEGNAVDQQTELVDLQSNVADLWSNAQTQQTTLSSVFVDLETETITANIITANAFIGDGSQLTNVGSSNASLLTEGTLSQDRLPTTIGNAQTSFVGDGSQLTNVGSSNASFLTEGTLSQDRLPTTIGNVNTTFLGNGALLTDVDATIPDNLDVSTVTANVFYGDGGFLSNIDIDVANIDLIMTSGYIQEDFDVLGNLTGNLVLANTDGTTAAPSYAFRSETDAGMYLAQANTLGFSVSGTEILSANLDGLHVSGNISASYLFGNGALLEGVASSNASSLTEGIISQIVLPQTLGNTVTDFVGQSVDVSGNISGTYILGNGALLEGVASSNASSLTEGVVAESVLPAYLQSSNLANSVLNNAEIELNLLVANLSAGNGSQTQPSYTFDESPSTGLYLYDANVIGFTTAGSEIAQVSTEGLVVSGNISGAYILGNGALLEGVASSNASSLTEGVISQNVLPQTLGNTLTSFVGNGYYLESLNAAALSGNIDADVVLDGNVDGEIILEGEMDASVLIVGGNLSIGVPILLEDGHASEPMLSFTNATTTGVYLESGNMGISTNGTGVLTVTPTALVPQSNETYDLGSSTNAFGSLYLSGNTLYLGNVVLKDEDGSLSTSAQLIGDGRGLSNLTAANINGLSDALDVIQATSVTANIFSGNGAGLDGILASNITGLTQALDVIQASSVDANVANVGIISVETVVSNILIDGEVTTTGNVFAGGNITAFASDKRLKSNIQPIQNAVELIKKLHGYTFTWRDDIPGLPMRGDDIGLLAQELQDLGLDQCVSPAPFDLDQLGHSRSGEQYLTIHYNKLFAVVIQALHDIIDAMAL